MVSLEFDRLVQVLAVSASEKVAASIVVRKWSKFEISERKRRKRS